MAVGSQCNDFGTPGVQQHCQFLDSRAQAERLHGMLLNRYMKSHAMDQSHPLEIAIVGAGATGVELCAELQHAVRVIQDYGVKHASPAALKITLLEASPRVLPVLNEKVSEAVHMALIGLGIDVRVGTAVREVTEDGMLLADGQSKQEVTGEVRIAAFGSVGVGLLPLAIQSLEQTHPQLNISLVEMEPTEGLKAAAANQVDLAVVDDMVTAESYASKLDFLPLCTDHFALVMSSKNRLAELKSIQLSDLANERWALNLSAISYHSFLLRAFRAAGFEPTVTSNCRNTAATLELVRASSLVTLLPNLTLGPIRKDPDFVCITMKPALIRRIFVVVPKGASKMPAVISVLDALRKAAPSDNLST
jgi:DNA-binding transcriptional LysR family regulator